MSATKNSRVDNQQRIIMDEVTKSFSEKLDRKKISRAAEDDLKLLNRFNFFVRTKTRSA